MEVDVSVTSTVSALVAFPLIVEVIVVGNLALSIVPEVILDAFS